MTSFVVDNERPIDLVAMGRVAVDLYAEQIGATLVDAQTFRKYLGGCAGNIAVGAARLGLKVSMLSCVGSDDLGLFLRRELISEGVDVAALQTSDKHLTGLVVLGVNPPDRFPLIFYRKDCADMAIDKTLINTDYFSKAKSLLITGTGLSHPTTRETTMHAINLARSVGCKIILDIDYRPVLWGRAPPGDGENRYVASSTISHVFASILPLVDLVVGTEEECKIAGGSDDDEQALSSLHKQTDAFIVMKMGARGAMCSLRDQKIVATTKPVDVVNVLGAGDGFMAGLLASLLTGARIEHALARANGAGALVVSRHGCSHASPSKRELDEFMSHGFSPKINVLHQRAIVKNKDREAPLPILAFCHRWQLEDECRRHSVSLTRIHEFKTALAESFVDARCSMKNAMMLCDPHYGKDALRYASEHNAPVIVAIEKSGEAKSEWLSEESAFEILYARPPSWGVKFLWQFHDGCLDSHHQIMRLKELARACTKLDRKLMLELIVPKDSDDHAVLDAVKRVYQEGVHPYWWKLASMSNIASYAHLGAILDEHDDAARVVILGGEAKDVDAYRDDFVRAQTIHHCIGFAVGRSIFWPSFVSYIKGQSTILDVKCEAHKKFLALYEQWQNACRS